MAGFLKKTGVVKAIQGHMALVLTKMEPECEGCKAKDGCSALGGGGANVEVRARNTAGAEVGDVVTITIRGASLVRISFMIYMVPMLALIGGLVFGYALSKFVSVNENFLVGIFGLLALSGAFLWLRKKGDKLTGKQEFVPEITSKKTPPQEIPLSDQACTVK
ncbi:MAG: hypothetical protein BA872_07585 [Desulfobacterales bacterium C00003060]|nr:MAG: hypothetical protein BA861_06410 [Desulfobacterales bacterium S3730MH5]OEU81159.1 MAG: hypothetical protein BA872_07585 [Desulfobacterales bacterium C00003060]